MTFNTVMIFISLLDLRQRGATAVDLDNGIVSAVFCSVMLN